MRNMKAIVRCGWVADRRAVTAIEYGMIGAFIFIVIVASVRSLGTALIPIFNNVSNGL